ncbi:DUF3237 domain-containing protein [Albimonas pacifica]|uniref:Uncharacterized protein n=1 Tax=Albimonas pacifica TaxID=1114924 RepID=A0A1I3NDJ8_9RHOB|nr:DUF3237 domain-containing protein [Albimonas pacifica]SFJ07374.1 Protein of unknown function [Albimonas pacifica]
MPFSATEPRLLPCWEAHVDIAPTLDHGAGPDGHRFVVPILGGRFEGRLAPETASPRPFKGEILPGGFDLQRLRPDGRKELEAIYHMRTDGGVAIEVRNLVLIDYAPDGGLAYARSRIFVCAPAGECDWLNARVFVGTLEVVRPQRQVLIRSFLLA